MVGLRTPVTNQNYHWSTGAGVMYDVTAFWHAVVGTVYILSVQCTCLWTVDRFVASNTMKQQKPETYTNGILTCHWAFMWVYVSSRDNGSRFRLDHSSSHYKRQSIIDSHAEARMHAFMDERHWRSIEKRRSWQSFTSNPFSDPWGWKLFSRRTCTSSLPVYSNMLIVLWSFIFIKSYNYTSEITSVSGRNWEVFRITAFVCHSTWTLKFVVTTVEEYAVCCGKGEAGPERNIY